MAGATHYPKATKHYLDAYPGVPMGGVDKLLVHSTEGSGWPGYDGGAKRPTLTYHPKTREWREHGRLDYSARALQDKTSTAVRENRDRVVQVEIIGTCDPVTHKAHPDWPYMPELTDANLNDLADLFAFLGREWGVPLVSAGLWLPYPASFGNSRARMTGPVYDAFRGLCAHQHASGNDHGDAGAIRHDLITAKARAINAPKPAPLPVTTASGEDDMFVGYTKADGRWYLFGIGVGKSYIPTSETLHFLVDKAKVRNVGEVPPTTAAFFPSLDLQNEAKVRQDVQARLTALADRLGAVQRDAADDATATQVAEVRQAIVELEQVVMVGRTPEGASA